MWSIYLIKSQCKWVLFKTCRVAHFSQCQRTKTLSKHLWECGGAKCWHPLARWMVLALTERSFPAHLHSSLLVGEAGQGICNTNTVSLYVRKESPPPRIRVTARAAACVRACVWMRVEEVTMRFVIHFVSVYSIIHPGVQRASNMPGTACDRVQQPWSKIFMRHFCAEKKRTSRDTWGLDWHSGCGMHT